MATAVDPKSRFAGVRTAIRAAAILGALLFVLQPAPAAAAAAAEKPSPKAATKSDAKNAAMPASKASAPETNAKTVKRKGFTALESWANGAPRIVARKWTEGEVAHQEQCFYSPEGEELGCGTLRNGSPWDGTFVRWAKPSKPAGDPPAAPRETTSWREGRKHGLWRAFNPDGSPQAELRFENGKLTSKGVVFKKPKGPAAPRQ
ncbi:MAG TPA: hypothetical protein DFS52_01215 [Myxococcales bacterium]|jgi:hypothetical protein|nr:hypothetical protein [Myxococcales bacterium]